MEKNKENDDYRSVITMQNFVKALSKCKKGVLWKNSVQRYLHHAIVNMYETVVSLDNCILPELISSKRITLYERGKKRVIVPIVIDDRMIQRVICDECLVPVLQRSLIYDNGASTKGKGVEFTRKRVLKHLRDAVREYGNNFYILTFDLKSFFDSIPHKSCADLLDRFFTDEKLKDLIMRIVRSYKICDAKKLPTEKEQVQFIDALNRNKMTGICLGSQISQVLALGVPNKLDHTIKDGKAVEHYIRYMDDGFIIAKTKDELRDLLDAIRSAVSSLGLRINEKKTHIMKSTKGFIFLKIHYYITESGKIVRKMAKTSITRMRRKLKKFQKKVEDGKMSIEDVWASLQSWNAHARRADSFHAAKNMKKLYACLYENRARRCCGT